MTCLYFDSFIPCVKIKGGNMPLSLSNPFSGLILTNTPNQNSDLNE